MFSFSFVLNVALMSSIKHQAKNSSSQFLFVSKVEVIKALLAHRHAQAFRVLPIPLLVAIRTSRILAYLLMKPSQFLALAVVIARASGQLTATGLDMNLLCISLTSHASTKSQKSGPIQKVTSNLDTYCSFGPRSKCIFWRRSGARSRSCSPGG